MENVFLGALPVKSRFVDYGRLKAENTGHH
jgi:hypothetical protein